MRNSKRDFNLSKVSLHFLNKVPFVQNLNKVRKFTLFLNGTRQTLAHQVQYSCGGILDIEEPVFVIV